MWGMYCCAERKEGHFPNGVKGCEGGDLHIGSICCENDKQLRCTKDGGCVNRRRNRPIIYLI